MTETILRGYSAFRYRPDSVIKKHSYLENFAHIGWIYYGLKVGFSDIFYFCLSARITGLSEHLSRFCRLKIPREDNKGSANLEFKVKRPLDLEL